MGNFRGRIRLRWRYQRERYTLPPYVYQPENLHPGAVKAAEIKLDILKSNFDPSLEKYKSDFTGKPVQVVAVQQALPQITEQPKSLIYLHDLAAKFSEWVVNIRNIGIENSIDYFYTRRLLEKWVGVPVDQVAQKMNAENQAAIT